MFQYLKSLYNKMKFKMFVFYVKLNQNVIIKYINSYYKTLK